MTTPQGLVERALDLSRTDGCVALAQESTTANLRWANNTLTTNGAARTRDLTVIAVAGGPGGASAGVVTRSGVTLDRVEDTVRAAEASAAALPPAEDAAPLLAGEAAAGFQEPPAETSIGVFSSLVPALGDLFEAAPAAGRILYGYAEHDLTTTYLGTSTGLRLRHSQPTGKIELTGRSRDGTRSAWAGRSTRDFTDVDVHALEAAVAQRLEWSKRRIELPAGRYETVLPPSAVGDLMVYLYWTAGALDAHEGRTVFSRPGGGTRVGERLTDARVSLRSDPALPGLEAAPFLATGMSSRLASIFDNGFGLGPTDWVRDGQLTALVQTRHSARVTGLEATPFVDNLLLEGPDGGRAIEDMVAATRRGLLLTCLWYIREVDPQTLLLTGLTRDGVFMVEDGEVVGVVNNFRFNESPVDLLGRLGELGAAEPTLPREFGDYFTRCAMPPVRVGDFNMSSVSPAS
ncbi:MAG TPA: metallopeptidase TldD-related protein [Actinomycetes bacterium]|nr:metallopeptidase TldD-related protein [Actinomycetes bacterium]